MAEDLTAADERTPLKFKLTPTRYESRIFPLVVQALNLFEVSILLSFIFYLPFMTDDCDSAPLQYWICITLGMFSLHVLFGMGQRIASRCMETNYHTENCLSLIHSFSMGIILMWMLLGNYWVFVPGLKCKDSDEFLGGLTIVVLFDLLLIITSVISLLNVLWQSVRRKD